MPIVIRENGLYKMWYYGMASWIWPRIGYATSPDGINWTKYAGNPVLGPGTSSWEAGGVLTGSVIPYEGGYKMWYYGGTINGLNGPLKMGYATSIDGISWQRDTVHNPILSPGTTGSWDSYWVCDPRVLLIDGMYYMWYTGTTGVMVNFQVGLATSSDGITDWIKHPGNPVLRPSQSGWDRGGIEVGNPIWVGDTLYLWYPGSTPIPYVYQVGLATSLFEPLPVELTSFTATSNGNEVILNWSTATELNNKGFEVQRKALGSEFATVAFVKGQGTTTQQNQYSFVEKNLDEGKYFYRLKQMDFGGQYSYSRVVEVEVRTLDKFTLEQNYPNPFNPVTTIGYVLQEKCTTKLTLLNSIGEKIAVLVNEEQDKGFHKVEIYGSKLSSGVYFYQLRANNYIETKKMIFLR